MNQILFSKFNEEIEKATNKGKKRILIFFKYQFIFSIIVILACVIYYSYILYNTRKEEELSAQFLSNYNINLLYSDMQDYSTSVVYENKDTNSFIIGIIEIKKLKIIYPIVSEANNDLLKFATCRFAGPLPNRTRKPLHCSTQL
jgi:sortase (surface protein transpeptidase)